jgi:hypothetical protein
VFRAIRTAFATGCHRAFVGLAEPAHGRRSSTSQHGAVEPVFRMTHFSVQSNHIHLICEARDEVVLAHGMQGLAVRIARRLNRVAERRGKVFATRYHARALTTPREVRHALVYVYGNARKHWPADRPPPRDWVDPCSSAPWFDGWVRPIRLPWAQREGATPVATAASWLLTTGWRRHGRLAFDELPRA